MMMRMMTIIMIMMMVVNLIRENGPGAKYDRLLAGSSDWSPDQTFRSEAILLFFECDIMWIIVILVVTTNIQVCVRVLKEWFSSYLSSFVPL